MNRKINGNENDQPELRFECDDWDKLEVRVKAGSDRTAALRRKVKTLGKTTIGATDILKIAICHLRSGNEVGLVDSQGNTCIRLYPVASKDCKRIYVAAQAMAALSQCMTDKKPVVMSGRGHAEKEMEASKLEGLIKAQEKKYEDCRGRVNVSPDTVVECPKCGYEFRVGKKLN